MLLGVSSSLSLYRGSFSCHFTAWNVPSKSLTGNFLIYSHLLDQRFFGKKNTHTHRHAFWGTLEHPPKRPTATKKSTCFVCVVKVEPTSTWNSSIFFAHHKTFLGGWHPLFARQGLWISWINFSSRNLEKGEIFNQKKIRIIFCDFEEKLSRMFFEIAMPLQEVWLYQLINRFFQRIACFRTWRR